MLKSQAQVNFAIDMGYNPTVSNAKVPDELNERMGFAHEEAKKLVDMDYGYMTENDVALKEWWDKTFKA